MFVPIKVYFEVCSNGLDRVVKDLDLKVLLFEVASYTPNELK